MKAKFTGHDTFPLRYGWLYKAVNHLNNNNKLLASSEDDSRKTIVELGVGKNMVNAIRYWAECASVIDIDKQQVSKYGAYLFGTDTEKAGKDPCLEHLGSIWLLHFWLNFDPETLTAYRYFFNHSNSQYFEKAQLTESLINAEKNLLHSEKNDNSSIATKESDEEQEAATSKKNETHKKTVKKDIDCFINTYCHKVKKSKTLNSINEDYFSSPLSELNLIHDNGGGYYNSTLGERTDLPIEVFIYAIIRYVQSKDIFNISFNDLLSSPCSPGRIFRLSKAGLDHKLYLAQLRTKNAIALNHTQGHHQVTINKKIMKNSTKYLDEMYDEKLYEK